MVGARGDRLQLALELPPRTQAVELERAVVDRREHGAARFPRVGAVAEAALGGERLDVGEGRAHVALPELQLPQAGRVDYERAAGQADEFAVCRRVAPR